MYIGNIYEMVNQMSQVEMHVVKDDTFEIHVEQVAVSGMMVENVDSVQ